MAHANTYSYIRGRSLREGGYMVKIKRCLTVRPRKQKDTKDGSSYPPQSITSCTRLSRVRDLSQPLETRVSVSDLIDTAGNQRSTSPRLMIPGLLRRIAFERQRDRPPNVSVSGSSISNELKFNRCRFTRLNEIPLGIERVGLPPRILKLWNFVLYVYVCWDCTIIMTIGE